MLLAVLVPVYREVIIGMASRKAKIHWVEVRQIG